MSRYCSAITLAACLLLPLSSRATEAVIVPKLIPQPAQMVQKAGNFTLQAHASVHTDASPQARQVGLQFKTMLGETFPLTLDNSGSTPPAIQFALDSVRAWPAEEAYAIRVDSKGVQVSAGSSKGLYYGAVTLAQLITSGATDVAAVTLPALQIEDRPRFGWRGVMLDSARHFQTVDEIKRLLDAMAQLKLDVFHWHLTDDQGWRFPVPGWPKLISVGSCRVPAGDGGRDAATGRTIPYCGYYTEAQIRDIVAYAAARHIEIVPEVDVPGHATAAIAAYPQLGVSGKPIAVSAEWGVNVNLFNADESTLRFLEDVLTQVVKLFPGRYVHIGGDEAVKDQWIASPKMQARIRELGVHGEEGLQAWMIARLGRFLSAHNRRLLGWDEILAGPLPEDATVMSWRGTEGGITAAKAGHDVVMAPSDVLYLDYLQTASGDEPPGRPTLSTLEEVYAFNPVPGVLNAAQANHILGVQANVWTEHMRDFGRVQHAYFPRIAALAEAAWSPQENRSYGNFLKRLPAMLPRWQAQGIAVAQTPFTPLSTLTAAANGDALIALQQPLGYSIRYTLDGSAPSVNSPEYFAPLQLALPATLNAQTFAEGKPLGLPQRYELTAAALLTRSDEQLAMCTGQLMLRLEDDGPRTGARATYNVDIFNPCWEWKRAPLTNIAAVQVRAGRIPYFFQLAHDEKSRGFKPAQTAFGEVALHAGCDGPLLASQPLPAQPDSDGFLTLTLPLQHAPSSADLCLWFTGDTRPTMWVLDRLTLVPAGKN